mmetsp:Transcript_22119/g.41217  ORF Transcript_22119/g.41217 Transcript_22119/m.41217 type:complete len:120 (+) Transcript_22119:1776-2135(+)
MIKTLTSRMIQLLRYLYRMLLHRLPRKGARQDEKVVFGESLPIMKHYDENLVRLGELQCKLQNTKADALEIFCVQRGKKIHVGRKQVQQTYQVANIIIPIQYRVVWCKAWQILKMPVKC